MILREILGTGRSCSKGRIDAELVHRGLSAGEIQRILLRSITTFCGGLLNDDTTLGIVAV